MVNTNIRRKMEAHRYCPGRSGTQNKSALDSYELFSEKIFVSRTTSHLWYTFMKLQPHCFCLKGPKSRTKSRVPKGDVKACCAPIKRRWVRIGATCLDCGQFASELSEPPRKKQSVDKQEMLKRNQGGSNRPPLTNSQLAIPATPETRMRTQP